MALFKSQVLTQASGSVGGLTYTRTGSGMVLRAKSMPVNPNTDNQQAIRSNFSTLTQMWMYDLDETERQSWIEYASNVSRKNKLGDTIFITGQNWFIRNNVVRLQCGLPLTRQINLAVFNVGPPPSKVTAVQDPGDDALTLNWTLSPTPTPVANVAMYLSRPHSSTVNFFKGPYLFDRVVASNTTTGQFASGRNWYTGQRIFVRLRALYADGRVSDSSDTSFVMEFDL